MAPNCSRFRVDYQLWDDERGAISSSAIVEANSKYDAKRSVKRRVSDAEITRVIPLSGKEVPA